MQIVIISDHPGASLLFGTGISAEHTIVWLKEEEKDLLPAYDLLIDTCFERHPTQIEQYRTSAKPVLIGSVLFSLQELGVLNEPVARFNHWATFMERTTVEYAVTYAQEESFENLFRQLGISFEKTKDVPGFVSARIVSLIINEAYLAAEESVSTREEIDTAMKLGTNYPNGPFEWCNRIGPKNVYLLLQKLSATAHRYKPAASLKPEA